MKNENQTKTERTLRGQAAIARTSFSARTLRGQAAMEYLMTYGWAILIIVIVLAVLLFYLPQFLRAPESCIFGQAGFTCSDRPPVVFVNSGSSDVRLAINVFNGQGKPVVVKHYLCTDAPPADVDVSDAQTPAGGNVTIGAGSIEQFDMVCEDRDGNTLGLTPGSDFRGSFIIWYNFHGDITPSGGSVLRQATATISANVLER